MKNNNNNIKQHNQKNIKFIWKDIKDLTPVRGQDEKSQTPAGKIYIGLQIGYLSRGCLRSH